MSEQSQDTPDQELAEIISKTLVEEGLVSEDKQSKLTKELATGQISSEDWRLYIESAISPKKDD